MTLNYEIPLETPAKKNHRINLKNGKSIPSKAFQSWHKIAILYFIGKTRPKKPINYPIQINLKFTHGTRQRRDSDNQATSILDLLKDLSIIEDDCWEIVQKITIENAYEQNKPKCEIKIMTI